MPYKSTFMSIIFNAVKMNTKSILYGTLKKFIMGAIVAASLHYGAAAMHCNGKMVIGIFHF